MDPNARKPGDPGTTDDDGQHLTPGMVKEEATSEPEPEATYWNFTVPELRDELEGRELSTEGNKADLVERLEENDADRAKQE